MLTYIQSNAISQLRVLAMSSILSCHIFQGLGNQWAWVLNVGVQIFFVISGYLYGQKEIKLWKIWFIERIKKLYIPYVFFALTMLSLYACFSNTPVKLSNVICYIFNIQGIIGGVNGLGHLWFMTAIFFCYFTVPFLQRLKRWSTVFMFFLLLIAVLQYTLIRFHLNFFSWFFLFSSGYFYACVSECWKRLFRIIILVGFVMVYMMISWKDIMDYNSWLNSLFHVTLGGTIVFYGELCLVWLKRESGRLIRWFDNLSFDIYITHHIFCLGSFSLIGLTPYLIINVVLIFVASISTAMLLKSTVSYILKK